MMSAKMQFVRDIQEQKKNRKSQMNSKEKKNTHTRLDSMC